MKDEEKEQHPKRRILCIDGGGIRGTFPAALLAGLEQHLQGRPIGSYFDLIAGTSTGGIIAIGLAMGLRASELLDLYEQRGPEIFGQGRGPVADFVFNKLRLGRWLLMNKHDAAPLQAVLEDVLGGKRIGDAKTRLLIPGMESGRPLRLHLQTAHHARFEPLQIPGGRCRSGDRRGADVLPPPRHATCRRPDRWRHMGEQPHGAGRRRSDHYAGLAAESLHVLSLGCLEETYTIRKWAGIGTLGSKITQTLHGRAVARRDGHRQATYRP